MHGNVAGHTVSFGRTGDTEVTCWLDRERWGEGIATAASSRLLDGSDTHQKSGR